MLENNCLNAPFAGNRVCKAADPISAKSTGSRDVGTTLVLDVLGENFGRTRRGFYDPFPRLLEGLIDLRFYRLCYQANTDDHAALLLFSRSFYYRIALHRRLPKYHLRDQSDPIVHRIRDKPPFGVTRVSLQNLVGILVG